MKLSIIIPYYNTEKYTPELLNALAPQITSEVECIVVDDGSLVPFSTPHHWVRIFRKPNGGAASARNMGIDGSTGEYLTFIDSDDMVPNYYVSKILSKIDETHADVIDLSWKSLNHEGAQHNFKLKSEDDYLTNPSVCTRVFKRSFIGDTRLNEKKEATEDEDFSRKLGYLIPGNNSHAAITDYMYYYRTAVTNSNVKNFKRGLTNTKRIVYYYPIVTADMYWLLDEIKKEDEVNEVYLLTERCDIPAIKRYCRVERPHNLWTHYLRGEPYNRCTIIPVPEKTDTILYISKAQIVSGLNTFIYNFCANIPNTIILYDEMDEALIRNFSKMTKVVKNDLSVDICCNSIILIRLKDSIPQNVTYNKSIRMCHCCKIPGYIIKKDCDYLVNVSEFSKKSWGIAAEKGLVIKNLSYKKSDELLLVSATRLQALDKGSNDTRFRALAEMLNRAEISFTWLNFSDKPLSDPPENFINMGSRVDVSTFIKRADYLVQLSDNREAFCYSLLEALELGTAVITTPLSVLSELGVHDGDNGYIVPFDMNFDVNKLRNIPRFRYHYDNQTIIDEWNKLLHKEGHIRKGSVKPTTKAQVSEDQMVKVKVLDKFYDKYTGKLIPKGITELPKTRVNEILKTQKKKGIKLIQML